MAKSTTKRVAAAKVTAAYPAQAKAGYAWGGQMDGLGPSYYRDAGAGLYGKGAVNALFQVKTSAYREIARDRNGAVRNARFSDRNHPFVNAAISKRATALVGADLRLQAQPNWRALGLDQVWAREFAQAAEYYFSQWGDDHRMLCDATRHNQFGSLMWLAARDCYGTSGETALVIRYDEERQAQLGSAFATFIEVIDPDRIATPATITEGDQRDGSRVLMGRRVDRYGAYTSLFVHHGHPSDVQPDEWTEVPRETEWGRPIGVHWFPMMRPGMQRAMPSIIQSLRNIKMLDDFDDKKLKSAVLATFLSMYVKTEKTSDEMLKALQQTPTSGAGGADGQDMADWDYRFDRYPELVVDGQPLPVLAPGDEIKFEAANPSQNDDEAFRYSFERSLSENLGITYSWGSGDYSKTSFASMRAARLDNSRITSKDRTQFTNHAASPAYVALLEELVAKGVMPMPRNAPDFTRNASLYATCSWRGPGDGYVDPVKDVQGAGMRIAAGFSSPQIEAAAQGNDWRDVIDDRAEAEAYARSKGVVVDYTFKAASAPDDTGESDAGPSEGGGDPKKKTGKPKDGDGDGQVEEQE